MSRRRRHRLPPGDARAQANLVSLAVALLVLTSVAVGGVVVADGALADADGDHQTRRVAVSLADELVASHAAHTFRANVLNETRVTNLTAGDLDSLVSGVTGRDVRVSLGERVLIQRGDPAGRTVERVVLVGNVTERQRVVGLADPVTVSSAGSGLDVDLRPAPDTTVHTVRVDDRVALHDPDGLSGTATVALPRDANATVTFETDGNTTGSATLTTDPLEAQATTLAVTVGSHDGSSGGDDG